MHLIFGMSRIADEALYKPMASVVGRHEIAATTRQPSPQRHFPSSQRLPNFHLVFFLRSDVPRRAALNYLLKTSLFSWNFVSPFFFFYLVKLILGK